MAASAAGGATMRLGERRTAPRSPAESPPGPIEAEGRGQSAPRGAHRGTSRCALNLVMIFSEFRGPKRTAIRKEACMFNGCYDSAHFHNISVLFLVSQ